jgi:hypothetical protein
MQLTFAYPAGYLILCALAGLAVSLLLYFRSPLEAPRPLLVGLAVLRFLGYSVLAALLLAPLLRYFDQQREEPVIVMAQDVSESVGLETDTLAYVAAWRRLGDRLAEDYRVVDYTFGGTVRQGGALTFSDRKTDLSAVLDEVSELYGNQNLGAVILASDGIYNQGSNPLYREFGLGAPVYTVALGDTTVRRDLVVRRVFHNEIAYLNDQFTIQIDLSARNAAGEATTLTVTRLGEGGSSRLHTERVNIDRPDFFTTREITLTADRPGVQRYRIAVSDIGEELSTANNRRDIFVDVLDARQRILILAAAPHPDVGALRQALSAGRNNEVTVAYAGDFAQDPAAFDLAILHQLPTSRYPVTGLLEQFAEAGTGYLIFLGEDTPAAQFNAAQGLVRSAGGGAQVRGNEVTATVVPEFRAFTLSEETRRALPVFPPLVAPFGTFAVTPAGRTVLRQRIGRVETEYPLLVVGEGQSMRTAVWLGTGLWQWRLFDYLEHDNHERFDELIGQLTQYLTVRDDKRRFRVSLAESVIDEGEAVRLDAELYNSSYELVNDPEASLTVYGPGDREYQYTFSRTESAYTLDAGSLPVGSYRYRATVGTGADQQTAEGRFSVQAIELERFAREADHGLLRQISERYGGQTVGPDDLGTLADILARGRQLRPIVYEVSRSYLALSIWWIGTLILLLFTAEWGLRRWVGGY